jgi:hypothetical protein
LKPKTAKPNSGKTSSKTSPAGEIKHAVDDEKPHKKEMQLQAFGEAKWNICPFIRPSRQIVGYFVTPEIYF